MLTLVTVGVADMLVLADAVRTDNCRRIVDPVQRDQQRGYRVEEGNGGYFGLICYQV